MIRKSTFLAAVLLMFANVINAQDYVVKMKTAHAIGEYMGFSIQSNGNPVDVVGAEYDNTDGTFKVTSQEVELRGKITRLDCSSNWLESLDVSGNPLLVELYCDNNRLTNLVLGSQPDLVELYVGDNKLTSLDLSGAPALTSLSCYKNNITSLNLSANTGLVDLVCRECKLEGTLDLSANAKLQKVACYNNDISAIRLAANNSIGKMEIERNNIKGQNMTDLVSSLPEYKTLEDYDDWFGMDPQGFYAFEYSSDFEDNVLTLADLQALKEKKWPVYAVDNVDEFYDLKEVDGTMVGISDINAAAAAAAYIYDIAGRAVSAGNAHGGLFVQKNGGKVRKVLVK